VTIVTSFIGLCVLLGVGQLLRMRIRLLQKLYLPSCVIAGLLGLLIVQCILAAGAALPDGWKVGDPPPGAWPGGGPEGGWSAGARFLVNCTAGWGKLPGFLINVVFACLFLGVKLPRFGQIVKRAGPQLAYGQTVAWGQYVVGVGLVLVLLGPVFGVPAMFGGVIPVGFEGGHGTAAGLADTFAELGWAEGKDFALASATAGIVSAIVVGMILINWAVRRGHVVRRRKAEQISREDSIGVIPPEKRPPAGRLTVSAAAIESLTLHVVAVGAAVLVGYLLKELLWQVEWALNHDLAWETRRTSAAYKIIKSFPLFPLCMLGGLVVQVVEQRFDKHHLIDSGLIRRIQNTSLDFLVVAAVATIQVASLRAGLAPFLILIAAGIAWNVFCVLVLARRLLPNAWFERSIAEMGQSMGVTATGLLLLRVVDPDYETPAADAFASKQLLHEPFMGGGLWTSMAIPLLAMWGGMSVFLVSVGAVVVWLAILAVMRRLRRNDGPE